MAILLPRSSRKRIARHPWSIPPPNFLEVSSRQLYVVTSGFSVHSSFFWFSLLFHMHLEMNSRSDPLRPPLLMDCAKWLFLFPSWSHLTVRGGLEPEHLKPHMGPTIAKTYYSLNLSVASPKERSSPTN